MISVQNFTKKYILLRNVAHVLNAPQKYFAQPGRKAYFALCGKFWNHSFNIETQNNLFDIYVNSVLNYGAEIWGFHKGYDIEKFHLMFCKKLLGVKKS